MHLYEASLKSTNPTTGQVKFDRLFTMRARNARHVQDHAATLGILSTLPRVGELVVYRY
jgi:hypothetical protein